MWIEDSIVHTKKKLILIRRKAIRDKESFQENSSSSSANSRNSKTSTVHSHQKINAPRAHFFSPADRWKKSKGKQGKKAKRASRNFSPVCRSGDSFSRKKKERIEKRRKRKKKGRIRISRFSSSLCRCQGIHC